MIKMEKFWIQKKDTHRGCTYTMSKYALGIVPLIDTLGEKVSKDECKQRWYADDSTATG